MAEVVSEAEGVDADPPAAGVLDHDVGLAAGVAGGDLADCERVAGHRLLLGSGGGRSPLHRIRYTNR